MDPYMGVGVVGMRVRLPFHSRVFDVALCGTALTEASRQRPTNGRCRRREGGKEKAKEKAKSRKDGTMSTSLRQQPYLWDRTMRELVSIILYYVYLLYIRI